MAEGAKIEWSRLLHQFLEAAPELGEAQKDLKQLL